MVHNNFQLTQAGVYRVLVTFNRTLKLKPVHNLSSPPFSLTSQFKRNQAFVQTYFLYKAIKLFPSHFLTFCNVILLLLRVNYPQKVSTFFLHQQTNWPTANSTDNPVDQPKWLTGEVSFKSSLSEHRRSISAPVLWVLSSLCIGCAVHA